MSIAPNVGGLARHLARLRTKESYLGMKKQYRKAMSATGISRRIYRLTSRLKNRIKHILLPITIFENMGFTYLGPVDGNDVEGMISLLRLARDMNQPVLIHIHTRKGLGYGPAEKDPSKFHGVGKFDPRTGISAGNKTAGFSDNFGRTMISLAQTEPRLCAITAAMPEGTGLRDFQVQFPERTFDVGIAEEHAVSMAGGLAKQGMIPVVALYSTFLQRSYDMILQDIAMLGLHVVLAVDRAGLVGEDGETHHGVFDIGFLRQAPGMTVLCPATLREQEQMLRWAVQECTGPVAVRYPRGGSRNVEDFPWQSSNPVCIHSRGQSDTVLITYGTLTENVLQAAQLLAKDGVDVSVLRLMQVAPLPMDAIWAALGDARKVIILEETCEGSGVKEVLAWNLHQKNAGIQVAGMDLGNRFVPHGALHALYEASHLDAESISCFVKEVIQHEN